MMSVPYARLLAASVLARGLGFGVAKRANAADFHDFDPENFDGAMLSAQNLKDMVAEAMKKTKPKNGKEYVFAFANLQRDIAFGVKVEGGIKQNAETAGVQLTVADNRL